ncbi:hypothetical protein [Kocuria tytonis]|nr:hypothetical protein [Kocuria tytonis]
MVTYCTSQQQADAEMAEWLKTAPGTSMPNNYGNQCSAAMQHYSVALFGRPWDQTLGYGNAIDHITNASEAYFVKVWNDPNNPNQLPRPGDIAVYKGAAPLWGGVYYGHTGAVESFTAYQQTLVQQDGAAQPAQLFPDGNYYSVKPAHKGTFRYVGDPFVGDIRGWLRPRWQKVVYSGADKRGYGSTTAVTNPGTTTGKPQAPVVTADLWMPGATRSPQPGAVNLNTRLPRRAAWHITSDVDPGKVQPSFSGVATYLKNAGYCPHLMWDPFTGHVEQFYLANVGARALKAWNEDGARHIQIEVLFSRGAYRDGKQYWELKDTPLKGFAQIIQWLDSHGIPRTWPMGPTPPIGTAGRRDVGVWNSGAGHYGHSQVPDNDHTDPGLFPSITEIPVATGKGTATATTAGDDLLEGLLSMDQATFDREKKKPGTPAWHLANGRDHAAGLTAAVKALTALVKGIPASVLQAKVTRKGAGSEGTVTQAEALAYEKANWSQDRANQQKIIEQQAQIIALLTEKKAA